MATAVTPAARWKRAGSARPGYAAPRPVATESAWEPRSATTATPIQTMVATRRAALPIRTTSAPTWAGRAASTRAAVTASSPPTSSATTATWPATTAAPPPVSARPATTAAADAVRALCGDGRVTVATCDDSNAATPGFSATFQSSLATSAERRRPAERASPRAVVTVSERGLEEVRRHATGRWIALDGCYQCQLEPTCTTGACTPVR